MKRFSDQRSGLHSALQLAVDVLRNPYLHSEQRVARLRAAQTIRDFLGRKRLNSKLSMRSKRRGGRRRQS